MTDCGESKQVRVIAQDDRVQLLIDGEGDTVMAYDLPPQVAHDIGEALIVAYTRAMTRADLADQPNVTVKFVDNSGRGVGAA